MTFTEERLKHARETAEADFAKHRITREGDGRFYCGKPGTGICHFRVIFAPRAIFLYGDIGELVLIPSDVDSFAWAHGLRSNGEVGYPLGKIPAPLNNSAREFCRELAVEVVAQEVADDNINAAQAETLLDAAAEGPDAWAREWSEIAHDREWPGAEWWTWRALYTLEALRWFVRNVEALAPAAVAS